MCQRSLQCALVAVMVLVGAPVWAQSVPSVSVNVQPAGAVQIVLVSGNATEKVLTTTDQKGQGSIDGVVLAKLGRLEVIEESCGPRKRVLLVASNGKVAAGAGCSTRPIGSFATGTDKTLKAELFTPLPRPPAIPDSPLPAPVAAPQRAAASPAQTQPVRPPATTGATAGSCPPGAGLIGPKLDLPEGGKTFEEATLLSPCTYKGLADANERKYFRVSLTNGQTLKVTARTRDSTAYPRHVNLRLHGPNGGLVGEKSSDQPSFIFELEYKAMESGFAYLAMTDVVRDVAFQISIQ